MVCCLDVHKICEATNQGLDNLVKSNIYPSYRMNERMWDAVMGQNRIVGLVIASALALGLSGSWASAADTFSVSKTEIVDRKAVFATVESIDQITARTRIGGTVSTLNIDEGSAVEKDQIISRVVDPKLRLSIAVVDARVQSLRAQKGLAVTALKRARNLRRTGVLSQAKLDQAETNLDVIDRQLAAMLAERKVISQQRAEGDVFAPVAGRVLKVFVAEGSVVMPGEQVAVIATEKYILRMSLPERHARFAKVGDSVLVGSQGGRTGTIRQVYPEISGGRVKADVNVDGLGDFFVGERMRVYVSAGTRTTFVVPESFVFHRHGVSFVQRKDGCETVVQPGQPAEDGIEILSGVIEGDVLVKPGSAPCGGR